jgi:hypothetical protein
VDRRHSGQARQVASDLAPARAFLYAASIMLLIRRLARLS